MGLGVPLEPSIYYCELCLGHVSGAIAQTKFQSSSQQKLHLVISPFHTHTLCMDDGGHSLVSPIVDITHGQRIVQERKYIP